MKTLPRFAIETAPGPGGLIRMTGTEAHHMRDVMRIAPGATVSLIDANGIECTASLERYDRTAAELRVIATRTAKARPPLILAQAIIKGPRMDFIVEKAAELGATELWPIVCARGLVRAPGIERHTRWDRLAIAASKQSMALPPMRVREAIDFHGLIREAPRDTLRLLCSAGADAIGAILGRTAPRAMLIAIGPEGDFDPREFAEASEAGFVAAGLGPARLRSETAALAALAIAGQFLAREV
ncbi:MAG: RsmE family RNA methyltransferase [Candidatus Binataceae bacterium]